MRDKANNKSLQDDVAKLAGSTVTDIKIGMYHVDFMLLGDLTITVRLKKEFKFTLGASEQMSFDPGLISHDRRNESTQFILLHGLQCRSARLSDDNFEMAFNTGVQLWVEITDNDFEPLELIGASDAQADSLEFYHVL